MKVIGVNDIGKNFTEDEKNINTLVKFFKESFLENKVKFASVPARLMIKKEHPFSVFGAMPAYCPEREIFVTKVATLVVGEDGEKNSVNSVVNVFDGKTGKLVALLDGNIVTNLKCAAVSAMVTDVCAIDTANKMALIGCGVQAWQQVLAVMSVRRINQLYLFGRCNAKKVKFAEKVKKKFGSDLKVLFTDSIKDTLRDADIVSTATTSRTPLFDDSGFKKNVHINCMGAHTCFSREVPNSLLKRSKVIVEDVDTAVSEAGELHRYSMTFFEMLRMNSNDLKQSTTVFSSVGHGYLDLLASDYLLKSSKI